MNESMQVLFVKQTGHVLAAFTRTADPEGKPLVSDLVGSGLFVRNRTSASSPPPHGGEIIVMPADALDVAVVDYDPDLFAAPIGFVAGGGRVAQLGVGGNQLVMHSANPPQPPPSPSPSAPPIKKPPEVNFNATRVTVVLEVDASDNKEIYVVLQEAKPPVGNEPERRIAQGVIQRGTHFVSLALKTSPDGSEASISDKDFFILALVAGYRPLFGTRKPAPLP